MRPGMEGVGHGGAAPREAQYIGRSGAARGTLGECAKSRAWVSSGIRTYQTTPDTVPLGADSSSIRVSATYPSEAAPEKLSWLATILRELRCAAVTRRRRGRLSTKPLISIIDDDKSYREAVSSLLKSSKFLVKSFPSAADFLASRFVHDTSCLITDINMPDMNGIELHKHLVESGCAIPTILITAYPDESARARVTADGVICYLSKPCDEALLINCVNSALKRAKSDKR
jgi:CheY-like chemotaxis protein